METGGLSRGKCWPRWFFLSLCFYVVVFWEMIWVRRFGKKKAQNFNLERCQFAAMNRSIGDDLMEDFAEVFLAHYKWQANPSPCSCSSPWASLWSVSQIFYVNLLAALCYPRQPELLAYLL